MDLVLRRLATTQTTRGPLSRILGVIIPMPLADRKTLLTICRVQEDPSTQRDLKPLWSTISSKSYYYEGSQSIKPGWYSVQDLSYWIKDRWTDCLWMGFISMLLRTLPVTDEEAKQAFQDSLVKEFEATQLLPRPTQLNYTFLHSSMVTDIQPGRAIKPAIYHLLHNGIQSFRAKMADSVIYPRSSMKSTSLSTKYQYAKRMGNMELLNDHISLLDVERMYSRGEGKIEGIVEMRQAWKYNDLKPRTYFACGGTMYYPSRYIQVVMNTLVDSFPSTDTYGRFSIERFSSLQPSEIVLLYDYTSFTSSMSEQKHFLAELAISMKGTPVTVVDTEVGPTTRDLGELLREYNDICNYEGEFSMATRLQIEGVYRHICASFLGVYGNISSCTALHGISLVSMLSSLDGASVIGDDAMARFMGEDMSVAEFGEGVSLLGTVHPDKYKVFKEEFIEEEGTYPTVWHYAKRPVKRLAGKMFQGRLIDWPMILYMITSNKAATSYHTVKNISPQKNLKVWCMQAGRLLDAVRDEEIDPESEELIRVYLEAGYRSWGLEFGGSVGHYVPKVKCFSLAYPCIDGTINFSDDWIDHLARKSYGESVMLPVEVDYDEVRPSFGSEIWETRMTPLLTLGCKMEWLSSEPIYESVVLSRGSLDRFISYLRFRPSSKYRFSILVDPPAWFEHMYSLCVD